MICIHTKYAAGLVYALYSIQTLNTMIFKPAPLFSSCLAVIATLLSLAAPLSAPAQEGMAQTTLERVALTAGMHRIDAQLAATPSQREIGLMFRKTMPQHEGMLFVFDQPSKQCFWMKNTVLPLSAAFVADDGTIVNLVDMKPLSLESHCSEKPVRYVLEMNVGWFAKKGISAGTKLQGSAFQVSR
jgi:hypothetical protein